MESQAGRDGAERPAREAEDWYPAVPCGRQDLALRDSRAIPQGVGGLGLGAATSRGSRRLCVVLCVFAYAAAVQSRKAEQSDLKREKACTNRSANVTAHSQQRKGGRAAWMPPMALAPCSLAWLPAHQPMDPLPGGWVTFLERQGSPEDFCHHPRHSATVARGFGSELEAIPNIWAEISEEIKHMFIIA